MAKIDVVMPQMGESIAEGTSPNGSRRPAMPSSATSRSSRSPPTRWTRRSRLPAPACWPKSWCRRGRRSRFRPSSRGWRPMLPNLPAPLLRLPLRPHRRPRRPAPAPSRPATAPAAAPRRHQRRSCSGAAAAASPQPAAAARRRSVPAATGGEHSLEERLRTKSTPPGAEDRGRAQRRHHRDSGQWPRRAGLPERSDELPGVGYSGRACCRPAAVRRHAVPQAARALLRSRRVATESVWCRALSSSRGTATRSSRGPGSGSSPPTT